MSNTYLLIVDDDEDDRLIFAEALKLVDESLEYVEAESGKSALRFLDSNIDRAPEIIFLDLNMPGMDGWQCLLEIRSRQKLNLVPIVIFSTSEESRHHNQPVSEISVYFMTKQFRMANLVTGIRSALAHKWSEVSSLNKVAYN